MTVEEAITELQHEIQWAEADLYPYVSKQMVNACNMAIKSLEAWGKMREEIKYHADNIKYTDAYRDGFEVSLKIIDKHLKEVSE